MKAGEPTSLRDASEAVRWLKSHAHALCMDSRRVAPGEAFIAYRGAHHDARTFMLQARQRGCSAILMEEGAPGVPEGLDAVPLASLPRLRAQLGTIAEDFYSQPSRQMLLLAVTGTNGKSSVAWWLARALALNHQRCALIGTLGAGEPPALEDFGGLTTPDAVTLRRLLQGFVQQGLQACVMEASSAGLAEGRMQALHLHTAIFTNFGRDHLDYHGHLENYWQAKRSLFDWPDLSAAILNIDDARGAALAQELQTRAPALQVWSFSTAAPSGPSASDQGARLWASNISEPTAALSFTLCESGSAQACAVQSRSFGAHNLQNLLAVAAALRALGVPLPRVAEILTQLEPVPGRLELISLGGSTTAQPQIFVDYAHTPEALRAVLTALAPVAAARGGQLHCLFGCGGERDAGKRPLMGAAAAEIAQRIVLTSDNPRSEAPEAILKAIEGGIAAAARSRVTVQPERARAIAECIAAAEANDVVVIAGKGHETTQETAGVHSAFSDQDHARNALQLWQQQHAPIATLSRLADWLGQEGLNVQRIGADIAIQRFHSDTRSLRPGDCFIALRGERFDGAQFLAEAKARGAVAAIAERGIAQAGLAGIEVARPQTALLTLARAWRKEWQKQWQRQPGKQSARLAAIAGSNGKTTVTQMVASILHAWLGGAALATEGNNNNSIGVPLTLLRLRAGHRAAVVELGMNHAGETALLAQSVLPDVALINNAQREHQEFLAGRSGVAEEHAHLLAALPAHGGIAIWPQGDAFAPLWQRASEQRGATIFTFALEDEAAQCHVRVLTSGVHQDLQIHLAELPIAGQSAAANLQTRLHMAGRHNVRNAAAAAACAWSLGAPASAIASGLQAFTPVAGRSALQHVGGVTLVDDAYNANPDSLRAAVDLLADLPAPRWMILGDMAEVGEQGAAFHAEIGAYAKSRGIDALWCAGTLSRHSADAFASARHFATQQALIAALAEGLRSIAPASLLVKASRSAKMESSIAALRSLLTGARDAA